MKKIKVAARQLTNKGSLLITTDDGLNISLNQEKIATMKALEIKVPNTGDEITVKPSKDAIGNVSTQWYDLVV